MLSLGLQAVVFFVWAVTSSAESPVASTALPIPSVLTPHYDTFPDFEVSPPAHISFKVSYVNDWGNLTDWAQLANNVSVERAGPATFCSIQNRSFWFFGNSTTQKLGSEATFFSSSISLAKTFSQPSWLVDVPSSQWPPIPSSPDENKVLDTYGMSFVTTPHTHCAVIGSNKAIQFWDAELDYCNVAAGQTLVVYQFDTVADVLTVTRPQAIYLAPEEYGYGSFATIAVDGTVYMYALEKGDYGGSFQDVHVASAPSSTVEDKSTWRFYDRGSGTWSSIEPFPTARRQSAAIISLPDGDYFPNEASIFYSVYHNSYLLVFLQTDYDYATERTAYRLKLKYSPTPVGPWSTTKVLYTFPVEVDRVLVTPVPFQTGSEIAGRTVLVSSTRYFEFVTTVRKLKFK